jgi:hypothetical protein
MCLKIRCDGWKNFGWGPKQGLSHRTMAAVACALPSCHNHHQYVHHCVHRPPRWAVVAVVCTISSEPSHSYCCPCAPSTSSRLHHVSTPSMPGHCRRVCPSMSKSLPKFSPNMLFHALNNEPSRSPFVIGPPKAQLLRTHCVLSHRHPSSVLELSMQPAGQRHGPKHGDLARSEHGTARS